VRRLAREAARLVPLVLLLPVAAVLETEGDTCTGSEARRPWLR
jgi:hypothetical protein